MTHRREKKNAPVLELKGRFAVIDVWRLPSRIVVMWWPLRRIGGMVRSWTVRPRGARRTDRVGATFSGLDVVRAVFARSCRRKRAVGVRP